MSKKLTDQSDIDSLVRKLGGLSPAELTALKRRWLPEYGGGDPRLSRREQDDPEMGRRVREALLILEQQVEKGAARLEVLRQALLRVYAGSKVPTKPLRAVPYRHTHESLAMKAKHVAVNRHMRRVTDFKNWVHSLYGYSYGDSSAMQEGKRVERKVRQRMRPPRTDEHWELICEDPLIDGQKPPIYAIPALAVNGEPMRGSPDVVLRHRPSNVLTIIERKSSHATIPADGWPDLRAQLWCYAQIDHPAWHNASGIRLVGEVWVELGNGMLKLRESDGGLMVWMKGDTVLEAQNAELFAIYKAKREGA